MAPMSQAAGLPHPLLKSRSGLPTPGLYPGLDNLSGMPLAFEPDTIPAHFGRLGVPPGMPGQGFGAPGAEDPTLELRRHMLRTRCCLLGLSPLIPAPAG